MKKEVVIKRSIDQYVGCFGKFRIEDRICKQFCVLSLRCSVENERNNRMAVIEDLISSDNTLFRVQ